MTISIKSPTSTTGSIQKNGSDVLTFDSSDNVTVVNNLSVSGTVSSTGAITFNGGVSGNVNFDSGTLYVDATNNRVGIGTSSPDFKLEVVGGTNNGIHIKDAESATVYGGLFTQASVLALVARSNHALTFGTNDTERMRIDSSGRITTPYTPKFLAYFTSASDFNVGGIFIFNATKFNEGNHYSTSTGAFTAPVTGLYNFTWNIFVTNSAGATQAMGQAAYINGSYYTGSDAFQTIAIPNSTGGYIVLTGSFNVQLNANDSFQLAIRGATNRVYGGHCWLGGYLIG